MFTLDQILSETNGRTGGDGGSIVVAENHVAGNVACENLAHIGGRVCLAVVGKLPWHKRGVSVDRAMTSKEALTQAGLAGWQLEKLQAYVDFNGHRVSTDSYAIVRIDNGVPIVLGSGMGERYTILSNEDCFAFMDDLAEDVRYETAGALGNGSTVWMLSDIPGSRFEPVRGDECHTKMLCSTSHDGTGAVKIFPTSVRPVCNNTHTAAMYDYRGARKRGAAITLRHTQSVKRRMALARAAIAETVKRFDEHAEHAIYLAHNRIDHDAYADKVLDSVLDTTIAGKRVNTQSLRDGSILDAICALDDSDKRLTAEIALSRHEKRRNGLLTEILETYHTDRCEPAGTGWASYNAVSEVVDHGSMLRYRGSEDKRAESRMVSLVDGRGAEIKQDAFQTALEMLG